MIENVRLETITNGDFTTYKHFLSQILCNAPSIDSNMGNCNSWPGTNQITDTLEKVFEENMIEKISFRQCSGSWDNSKKFNWVPWDVI